MPIGAESGASRRDAADGRGRFILVAGPSGVGKDSLLRGARDAFAGDPSLVFCRRLITRRADPDDEDHLTLSRAEFERLRGEGGFSLHWEAHGLGYALPGEVADSLSLGFSVVANVSRTVIDEARRRFPPVRVVLVEADPARLAARLAGRGREDDAGRQGRLARAGLAVEDGPDVTRFRNDGTLAEGVAGFVDLLRRLKAS